MIKENSELKKEIQSLKHKVFGPMPLISEPKSENDSIRKSTRKSCGIKSRLSVVEEGESARQRAGNQTPNHLYDYSEKSQRNQAEELPEEPDSAAKNKEVDALQQEILNIEQTLNRELRIKNRKLQKLEAQLYEVKCFLRKLVSDFVLTDDVVGEITTMQDNLDEKMSDDSQMFLSSNWSMGGLSVPCHDTVIFDKKAVSGIPALNM